MLRGIMSFVMFWAVAGVAISLVRVMTGKEKLAVLKCAAYAALAAGIATALLFFIVVIF